MTRLKLNLLAVIAFAFVSLHGWTENVLAAESALNQLLLEKSHLEKQHGIKSLECFPFIRDIGFTENQIPLIANCLQGARTLKAALVEVSEPDIRTVGISTRFLRTGGFHTLLVPWDVSKEKLIQLLKQNKSPDEREKFLDKIHALKRAIAQEIKIEQLYCSMEISNEQCLTGYQNLATVEPGNSLKKMKWREIVISATQRPLKDPYSLALSFNSPPQNMLDHLKKDIDQIWSAKKRVYEEIQTQHGQAFKERLQSENFLCAPDLSAEECKQGALNLSQASEDDILQEKFWGRVTIDRFNTLVQDDFHVTLRYDLPAAEIIKHFSQKPSRKEATRNTIRAEKLEGRSKNNHAGLRAVCDLEGLGSELCAKAFQNFIDFLKKNRDYRVSPPWTDLMFVDGSQLSRVNFALNSSSRDTYIYIDANTALKEMRDYLMAFSKKTGDKK
ncbi:MAG: hypothetical protein NPINA01_01480 [Nitrospinaceae bacterium]|nr:MAG: hypothetical protein NPINA01_01480 [Nitrospinaceae bacterium]